MSLAFSAILPHSPLLIPAIGKENIARLSNSISAINILAEKLSKINLDGLLIITSHSSIEAPFFNLNVCTRYFAGFEEFGEFTSKTEWIGDMDLAGIIEDQLASEKKLHIISEPTMDHGSAVPLTLLADALKSVKILILQHSSELSNEDHYNLGIKLSNVILSSERKIGVISSGDLSHRLTKEAPGGYSPKGKKFDRKLIDLLVEQRHDDLIKFDPKLANEASQCGLKSITVLMGILDKIKKEPRLLSYEGPFGVGHVVMNFEL